jgi:putative copper export protein
VRAELINAGVWVGGLFVLILVLDHAIHRAIRKSRRGDPE